MPTRRSPLVSDPGPTSGTPQGDYAHMASAKLITAAKGSEHSTERADLRGRRLVVAEEMTEDRALDVTAIKQIQDVPEITARLVHRDNMTFPASHSLICTSNYLPVVAETDHGTWRRLALVEFPYTFRKPGEALDDSGTEKRGDPALKQRVHDGADGQHDAAVMWAVDGAVRVAKEAPTRWPSRPSSRTPLTGGVAPRTASSATGAST